MNIFSNNAMTAFELRLPASESETGNTFTGASWTSEAISGFGVFKPRANSDIEEQNPNATGQATLNIAPSVLPTELDTPDEQLVGSTVKVGGGVYTVVRVATGKNFRTGEVEHYRLFLSVDEREGDE